MRLIILTITCIGSIHFANAQYRLPLNSGSDKYVRYDSPYKFTLPHNEVVPERFPGKSLILPGAMITVGFFAMKTDATLDVNEHIRKEMWTESPHNPVHIDNYLQFAPALAVYGLNIAGIKGKNNLLDRMTPTGTPDPKRDDQDSQGDSAHKRPPPTSRHHCPSL